MKQTPQKCSHKQAVADMRHIALIVSFPKSHFVGIQTFKIPIFRYLPTIYIIVLLHSNFGCKSTALYKPGTYPQGIKILI
jgi:hypothetical protein